MIELGRDSDGETNSETINSSQSSSSMSIDSCTSFSRNSFDTLEIPPTKPFSPQNLSVKPHRSSDSAYEAIRSAAISRENGLSFEDFKLIRRIGSGDIGTVYLCRLKARGSSCEQAETSSFYAMKVVDKDALVLKKKSERAEVEKRILKMLDHPFLPSLYADFEAKQFSCVVMEFCSGGDLHSLRHKQPRKRFDLNSARFYAAEVLVAMEYLHMLGIIYRDLKPENILVRSDGHIMLSDFDLSLCSDAIPVVDSNFPETPPATGDKNSISCFRFFRSRKVQTLVNNRMFVAEPVSARSCSFVGTHEYVSPEVASGKSHGAGVDWWAFGIFIYEMVYGRTPFSGDSNESTLRNIVKKPLAFPTEAPVTSSELHVRDLISGLLAKEPSGRLGSKRGAADVKTHSFFKGLNFALVRSLTPPEIPGLIRQQSTASCLREKNQKPSKAFDYF